MNFKKPKFWDSPGLSFWSSVLYPLSIIFLITSQLLNIFKSKKKFPIPIICIGNIYLGGTGKTPLALEIFKIIKSLGKNPAFVKKGYEYLYDEIKMLGKVGKTFSDRNRTTSINSLVSSGYDVAILDDGFQDISIAKDFSILCFTSNQWIGNGFVIPSGPLRERIESIKKADCIVINGENNKSINEKIKKINNNIKIFYSKYKIKNIGNLKNKKYVALAGIGNPSNFFKLLKENNIKIVKTHSYPDHYNYSQKDFNYILENSNEKIITTEKDFSRMSDKQKLICDYVEIDLEIDEKQEFINLIKNKL
tara:strand:+ start:214 stop:1134 length:921 start_codon:yes stop_codon:yes gene_type:complete